MITQSEIVCFALYIKLYFLRIIKRVVTVDKFVQRYDVFIRINFEDIDVCVI